MTNADPVNILLVDDQPAKLMSYEVILRELGENLLTASSAQEAFQHLLRHEIAVVLIDVIMPDLDGFELAQMIRSHPRFETTAIIFVSAVASTDIDRIKGYKHGAVDYVQVPVVPEVLRAKVRVFSELFRKTRQLERLNAELERRVDARTAELAETNAELERRVEERTAEREQALSQVHEMQKLESLGQLTGGLAHDFNNVLMAIIGNLDLLARILPEGVKGRALVSSAVQAAERGATLAKRMLAFARRQDLRPEAVSVPHLVGSMVEMLRSSLGPTIEIETDFREPLSLVRVDPNQLELALLNLALNARDAMDDGGALTIAARDGRRRPDAGSRVGRLCLRLGRGRRLRHGRGHAEARGRAVLHHEGRGQGHRARALDGLWAGRAIGRRDPAAQPDRRWHEGRAVAAGGGTGRGGAAAAGTVHLGARLRAAPMPCCSSTTIRWWRRARARCCTSSATAS